MKAQVKGPVVVIAIIAVVGFVVYLGMNTISNSGGLDHGQIKYTPGKPPWMEKDSSKKGPGGSPGVANSNGSAAPGMPGGSPVINNTGK